MKLLVIGHVWPQPDATAAGEHMLHLISFFQKMNYEILFVSAAQKPDNYKDLSNLSISTQYIQLNDDGFDSLLLDYQPTVVLFDRFMTEEQFSWRVYKNCPNAVRILDTEDLHFLRNQRLDTIKGKATTELSDICKREIASIYRSDLSLIVSKHEIELLTNTYNIPSNLLYYLPLLNKSEATSFNNFNTRKDFIFVGNFLHLPNWNCVQYLKKEIWPRLSKKLPKATLHIYGSHATQKNIQLSNVKERFIVHGYIADLDKELNNAKILLAPIQFGAGQKGKLVKAMQFGLPSVTTPIGAEGMFFDNQWAGAIADTVDSIIDQAVTLYTQEADWKKAQQKCSKIINDHFNYDTFFSEFQSALSFTKNNLSNIRSKNVVGQVLWHHSLRSTEFMSRWIIEKKKIKCLKGYCNLKEEHF